MVYVLLIVYVGNIYQISGGKELHKKKEYLWTVIILAGIIFFSFLPDFFYYQTDFWRNCKLIVAIRNLGFSYTTALHTLKIILESLLRQLVLLSRLVFIT